MSLCLLISYQDGAKQPPSLLVDKNAVNSNGDWPPLFRFPAIRRQVILFPFEVVVALWCAYSGAIGVLGIGPAADVFYRALGSISVPFNVGYAVAGISMYLGVSFTRRNVEAFGLILVISSLAIRTIALMWAVGSDSTLINQYVLNGLFFLAATARLISLWRHYYVIEIAAKDDAR